MMYERTKQSMQERKILRGQTQTEKHHKTGTCTQGTLQNNAKNCNEKRDKKSEKRSIGEDLLKTFLDRACAFVANAFVQVTILIFVTHKFGPLVSMVIFFSVHRLQRSSRLVFIWMDLNTNSN